MNREKFYDELQREVMEKLNHSCRVEHKQILKNNGIELEALLIYEEGRNISPTIYLEPYYRSFCNGKSIEKLAGELIGIYYSQTPTQDFDISYFTDYEQIKSRICYKLINREKNRELLMDIPHIPYLDLEICFYCVCENDLIGKGSILIHNSHMKEWKVEVEELYEKAVENTKRLFKAEILPMRDMLMTLSGSQKDEYNIDEKDFEDLYQQIPISVLTNEEKTCGAACILYAGILEEYGREKQIDFYVVPSSIHEMLLIPKSEYINEEYLQNTIKEVNTFQLDEQEILSNHLYFYDTRAQRLGIVGE